MTKPIHLPHAMHARADAPQRAKKLEVLRVTKSARAQFNVKPAEYGTCSKCGSACHQFNVVDEYALARNSLVLIGACCDCCDWFIGTTLTRTSKIAAKKAEEKALGGSTDEDLI